MIDNIPLNLADIVMDVTETLAVDTTYLSVAGDDYYDSCDSGGSTGGGGCDTGGSDTGATQG